MAKTEAPLQHMCCAEAPTPREFFYLDGKPGRESAKVLGDNLPKGFFADGGVIVRRENPNRFLAFASEAEFWRFHDSVPEADRCFHEHVPGHLPQRFAVDLDMTEAGLESLECSLFRRDDAAGDKAAAVLKHVIEKVCDVLMMEFAGDNIFPEPEDMAVYSSSGPADEGGGFKHSFHVIYPDYALASARDTKHVARIVHERLEPAITAARLFDMAVYSYGGDLRVPGSHKAGSARTKAALQLPERYLNQRVLVRPPRDSVKVLRPIAGEPGEARDASLLSDDVRAILAFLGERGIMDGFSFKESRGSSLFFDRTRPTTCRLCAVRHERANSLIVRVRAVPNTRTDDVCEWEVREMCGRGRGSLSHGRISLKAPANLQYTEAHKRGILRSQIDAISSGRVDPHVVTEFERLPAANTERYSEPYMRPYKVRATYVIKAQMKCGKTKALRELIDRAMGDTELRRRRIVWITPRRTFSNSLRGAFADFVNYEDVTGPLESHDRLIVQTESLHRYHPCGRIDLLILDEVEGVLSQWKSGLHQRLSESWAVFKYLLNFSDSVCAMDAFVGDRTFHTLRSLRPEHPIHFHWNQFSRAKDDTFKFTANKEEWTRLLIARMAAGEHVVVPTNSLVEAKSCMEMLRRRFPQKKIMSYTGETSDSIKKEHFGDVARYWTGLDCLLYTPTATVGISYECEWYDSVFAYFTDKSCGVKDCLQMLARVRNVRKAEYVMCVMGTPKRLPTDIEELRQGVFDVRSGLFGGSPPIGSMDYDEDGRPVFHRSDYFSMWLWSKRDENISRANFVRVMVSTVADTQATIQFLESDVAEKGTRVAIKEEKRGIKAELEFARAGDVAGARELNTEEAADVWRKARNGQAEQEDKFALEKYTMRKGFSFFDGITRSWVMLYSDKKSVFKNLTAIAAGRSFPESVEIIKRGNREMFMREVMTQHMCCAARPGGAGLDEAESRDLNRSYDYAIHEMVAPIIEILGVACISSISLISGRGLRGRISARAGALGDYVRKCCLELNIMMAKKKRALLLSGDFIEFMMFMNRILTDVYGIELGMHQEGAAAFLYLDWSRANRLFRIVPARDRAELAARDPADGRPVILSALVPPADYDRTFLDECGECDEPDECGELDEPRRVEE